MRSVASRPQFVWSRNVCSEIWALRPSRRSVLRSGGIERSEAPDGTGARFARSSPASPGLAMNSRADNIARMRRRLAALHAFVEASAWKLATSSGLHAA